MRLVIITGLPGSGKTRALHMLTDRNSGRILGGEATDSVPYSEEALLRMPTGVRVLAIDTPAEAPYHAQEVTAREAEIMRQRFDVVLVAVRTSRHRSDSGLLGALIERAVEVLALESRSLVARNAQSTAA